MGQFMRSQRQWLRNVESSNIDRPDSERSDPDVEGASELMPYVDWSFDIAFRGGSTKSPTRKD